MKGTIVKKRVKTIIYDSVKKQPPEMFYKKRCSQKSCEINRKAPVSESLFQQP